MRFVIDTYRPLNRCYSLSNRGMHCFETDLITYKYVGFNPSTCFEHILSVGLYRQCCDLY